MQWQVKKFGDTRFVTKFAWLPVKLQDGRRMLWLEKYNCQETYGPTGFLWCVGWRVIVAWPIPPVRTAK